MSSSSRTAPGGHRGRRRPGRGLALAPPEPDRPPVSHARPPGGLADPGRLELRARGLEGAQPLEPGHQLALAVVEPRVDVEREHVPAARGPHAERDRHGELRLVGDRHRDPAHAQLLGALRRAAVEHDRRLAGRQPLDLDVLPADPADAQAQHLGHGLLGGPAPGERLGPLADVALLAGRQDAVGEPLAEPLDRGLDPVDLDDVDARARSCRAGRWPAEHRRARGAASRCAAIPYSTVTDFARFRGWSTSVPRATAVWYANSWSGITASTGGSASCVSGTHRTSSA